MITTLIALLIVALVLYCVYLLVALFMPGQFLVIVGIILGLCFLLYALQRLNIAL